MKTNIQPSHGRNITLFQGLWAGSLTDTAPHPVLLWRPFRTKLINQKLKKENIRQR